MVNYILKNGSEINKPFEFETQQTIGSNGLLNSYNAIGGKKGKLQLLFIFMIKEMGKAGEIIVNFIQNLVSVR